MKRREFLATAGGAALCPRVAHAEQTKKVARIGFLDPGYASAFVPYVDAFRAGLRDLGYVDGKGVLIDFRWA